MNAQPNSVCPVCGEGNLKSVVKPKKFAYKDNVLWINNYPFCCCPSCKKEFDCSVDMKQFHKVVNRFHHFVDSQLV